MTRIEDHAPPGTRISDHAGEFHLTNTLARWMSTKLEKNRGKRHWRDVEITDDYLLDRLDQEVAELWDALLGPDVDHREVWAEAADVAIFAAFIADRAEARWIESLGGQGEAYRPGPDPDAHLP